MLNTTVLQSVTTHQALCPLSLQFLHLPARYDNGLRSTVQHCGTSARLILGLNGAMTDAYTVDESYASVVRLTAKHCLYHLKANWNLETRGKNTSSLCRPCVCTIQGNRRQNVTSRNVTNSCCSSQRVITYVSGLHRQRLVPLRVLRENNCLNKNNPSQSIDL